MANPTINDVRDDLVSQLTPLLVGPTLLQAFKSYPTIATTGESPIGMLAFMGTASEGGTVASGFDNNDRNYYDFALIAAAKCERGNESQWEAAENVLNDIETVILDYGLKLRSALWTKIVYRQPSTRPPAPPEFPYWRWAEIYLRVLLH